MDFALFVLLNAVLLIRPAEVVPALRDLQIYEGVILCCLLTSLFPVLRQLSFASLTARPITVCVLGMLAAVSLSHAGNLYLEGAWDAGLEFAKVVLYYLLFTATVNTPARLRKFLLWLLVFVLVLTALALLNYHGVVEIQGLDSIKDKYRDPETGEQVLLKRLCSSGIFNDPNDLSLILLTGMALCLYGLCDPRARLAGLPWLVPLGVFGHAFLLTHSRGGFLALLAGVGALFWTRYGWRRTVVLSAVALPVLLVLFGGRQTQIDTSGGTGKERLRLWNEGIALFRQSPVVGIGQNRYAEEVGLVAHNSYLHCYAELGVVGGTFFVGAYYFALYALYRLGSPRIRILNSELSRLRPFLLATIAAYVVGMMSLTRSYTLPTYLNLGLVTTFLGVTRTSPPLPGCRLNAALVGRVAAISSVIVAAIYLAARFLGRLE